MNRSKESSKLTNPRQDGAIHAVALKPVQELGRYRVLELGLPRPEGSRAPSNLFGKYVLARCAAPSVESSRSIRTDWDIYLRRAIFMIGVAPIPGDGLASALRFLIPNTPDPGYEWLAALSAGAEVNLLGPFGREVELSAHARHLLLASGVEDAPLLIPLADRMLDQGGRVTFIVRGPSADRSLLSLLPLDVELRIAETAEQFEALLADSLPWSDALCACDSALAPQSLADAVRKSRLTLEAGYAHVLVRADLVCGAGGCMACVVPRREPSGRGSLTRACVHGPAFPLSTLAL